MAKDPAFLFYYQDFLVGTDDMTLPQLGAFIRCLCHQASKGTLTEAHMKKICETHEIHMSIISKFIRDDAGNFFNERLRIETEKRKAYVNSRKLNRSKSNSSKSHMKNISKTYVPHMEDEDVNANRDRESSKEHKASNSKKNETVDLAYPYTGEKFMQVWNELIRGPKWKRKTKAALQASLIQIGEYSEGNEATAIQIMMNSLAGNWQGVFPIDRKNQHTMTNGREKTDASIAAKFVSDTNEAIRIFRERHQG